MDTVYCFFLGIHHSPEEAAPFFTSITYALALTLILTGPLQLILARYASDQVFEKKFKEVFSSFVTSIFLVISVSFIIAVPIFIWQGMGGLIERLSAAYLMCILGCIWTATTYLTALKNFKAVLYSFFIGYLSSFALSLGASYYLGISYAMTGFVIGQTILFLLMARAFCLEWGMPFQFNLDFLRYFKLHPALVTCGLFYNLGLWVDKFIYWFLSPQNMQVGSIFYSCPLYDVAVYLSFISIAPGMAVFLMKLETDFAEKMMQFTDCIFNHATYEEMSRLNEEIKVSIREGIGLLIKVQAVVTGVLLVSADRVLKLLNFGAVQTGIFQLALVGVFVLVIFLSLLTVLFYLDRIKDAAICCVFFFVANTTFTYINIQGGEQWYGSGFALSAALTLVPAMYFVNIHLDRLLYRTLVGIPIKGISD